MDFCTDQINNNLIRLIEDFFKFNFYLFFLIIIKLIKVPLGSAWRSVPLVEYWILILEVLSSILGPTSWIPSLSEVARGPSSESQWVPVKGKIWRLEHSVSIVWHKVINEGSTI